MSTGTGAEANSPLWGRDKCHGLSRDNRVQTGINEKRARTPRLGLARFSYRALCCVSIALLQALDEGYECFQVRVRRWHHRHACILSDVGGVLELGRDVIRRHFFACDSRIHGGAFALISVTSAAHVFVGGVEGFALGYQRIRSGRSGRFAACWSCG